MTNEEWQYRIENSQIAFHEDALKVLWFLAVVFAVLVGYHTMFRTLPDPDIGRYQIVSMGNNTAIKMDTTNGQTQILLPSNQKEDHFNSMTWYYLDDITMLRIRESIKNGNSFEGPR